MNIFSFLMSVSISFEKGEGVTVRDKSIGNETKFLGKSQNLLWSFLAMSGTESAVIAVCENLELQNCLICRNSSSLTIRNGSA